MITRFRIQNFKSLVDFELPAPGVNLPAFSCLVGLNGSGKSTVLQALDFAAHVATGGVVDWLKRREWKPSDLASNVTERRISGLALNVQAMDGKGVRFEWIARVNLPNLKCNIESVTADGHHRMSLTKEGLIYSTDAAPEVHLRYVGPPLDYSGSILNVFRLEGEYNQVSAIRRELAGIRSLELLSPHVIRRRARTADDIGAGGEKLSAFLSGLKNTHLESVLNDLQCFYPHVESLHTKSLRSGWKRLLIGENYGTGTSIDANHVNDGMLRILAIIAQAHTDHSFLLFDEIENGINPALVPKLMEYLVNLTRDGRKQVMVTTHSPVILNYLDDEVAKEGVILLYKKQDGKTRSIRYFDIPENARKLKSLGPGEVFVDTDLTELVESLPGEPEPLESDPPKAAPARRK